MNTRRAYVDLIYNGTAATAEISGFVTDISYTDPARWSCCPLPTAGADAVWPCCRCEVIP